MVQGEELQGEELQGSGEELTSGGLVQGEPQLEAVGVVGLDLLQLRPKQDVLFGLRAHEEEKKERVVRLCKSPRSTMDQLIRG
jgi:hypothetical protein